MLGYDYEIMYKKGKFKQRTSNTGKVLPIETSKGLAIE